MTWVKVCGMRTVGDLEAADAAGADALGLVLVKGTPRYLDVDDAARLAALSPVPAVILTLNVHPAELVELLDRVGAAGVQPYGHHAPEAAEAAEAAGASCYGHTGCEARWTSGRSLPDTPPFSTATHPTDWAEPARRSRRSGSLRPAVATSSRAVSTLRTVADAVSRYRPWGVDASSGLESAPGVKDPARIHSFVRNAKRVEEGS